MTGKKSFSWCSNEDPMAISFFSLHGGPVLSGSDDRSSLHDKIISCVIWYASFLSHFHSISFVYCRYFKVLGVHMDGEDLSCINYPQYFILTSMSNLWLIWKFLCPALQIIGPNKDNYHCWRWLCISIVCFIKGSWYSDQYDQ